MRARRWTVVVVGEGTDSPREMRLSSHAIRGAVVAAVTTLAVIVALAAAIGVAYGHRQARVEAALGLPTDPAIAAGMLRDSILSLDQQTTALRVVAGLAGPALPMPNVGDSAGADVAGRSVDVLLRLADQLSANLQEVTVKLHRDADQVARTPSIMPTTGWLTSQFSLSRFHPILHRYLPHLGIDIAAPYGTTIVAPAAGTVIRAGSASGYGQVLEIDHGNGIVTKYGHLSRFLVHIRQSVVRGQPIAQVGNSGLATGPHLHYEVHVNGAIVDPLTYVLPSTIPDRVQPIRPVVGAPED